MYATEEFSYPQNCPQEPCPSRCCDNFSILLISNLSSIVDSFLHPEIPYFDKKHLIVGGITSLMSSILFCMTLLYAWYLEQALTQIKVLKAFLPICSNCKKIQVIDSKTDTLESW